MTSPFFQKIRIVVGLNFNPTNLSRKRKMRKKKRILNTDLIYIKKK